MKNSFGLILSLVIFYGAVSFAFDVPKLTGPVVDEVNLLGPNERAELEKVIRAAHQRGKVQLQIAILKNLQGEPIESVSIKITDTWKLGDAKKDNGVLFLVAVEDKKMRIEVGQGLEGDIPDVTARRILQARVQPLFRAGQFAQGVREGVYEILSRADPEFVQGSREALPEESPRENKNWMFFLYLLIFIIFTMMRSSRRAFGSRRSGWGAIGGLGGFGGGRGGGGGWSGGGGGFSGGGSSSDW